MTLIGHTEAGRINGMRVIVLSPHADDAVWSLGGLIGLVASCVEVQVITVYDGHAPDGTSAGHAEGWRGLRSVDLRRAEDAKALDLPGVLRIGLAQPEAAFRQDTEGRFACADLNDVFPSYEALRHGGPPPWLHQLELIVRDDDVVVAPMAFGRHIDHYLTFMAARSLPGKDVLYYAEFPYWEGSDRQAVHEHLGRLGLQADAIALPADWDAWRSKAALYRSQVLRLFGSNANFFQRLERFARGGGTQASCLIWQMRR